MRESRDVGEEGNNDQKDLEESAGEKMDGGDEIDKASFGDDEGETS